MTLSTKSRDTTTAKTKLPNNSQIPLHPHFSIPPQPKPNLFTILTFPSPSTPLPLFPVLNPSQRLRSTFH